MPEVALFGLSGNPPTGEWGHRGIVRQLVASNRFSQIIIFPVYHHLFSSKSNLAPFDHRMEMCRLNFSDLATPTCQIVISNIEKILCQTSSERIGTIDVLKHWKNEFRNENIDICLILGWDTACDLVNGKWKSSNEILSEYRIIVFSRQGVSQIDKLEHNIETIDCSILGEISSSVIREAFCHDGNLHSSHWSENAINPSVLKYILENKVY